MVTKGYLVRYSINNTNALNTYMIDVEVKVSASDNVGTRAENILKKIAEAHFKNNYENVDFKDIVPVLLVEI